MSRPAPVTVSNVEIDLPGRITYAIDHLTEGRRRWAFTRNGEVLAVYLTRARAEREAQACADAWNTTGLETPMVLLYQALAAQGRTLGMGVVPASVFTTKYR